MGDTDRRRVAENLWKILADAKQQGWRIAEILHEGGQGSTGDSTKRLPRYALDPSLPQEVKDNRADKLTQDPRRYLKIGEAAGRLLYGDDGYFLAELFGGTSIAAPSPRRSDVDTSDIYTELADLIAETAAALVQKHDLRRVFRHIEEYRLWRGDTFRPYHRGKEGSLCVGDEDWGALWRNFADGTRVIGIDDLADEYDTPQPRFWDKAWVLPYPTVRVGWSGPTWHPLERGHDLIPFTMYSTKKGKWEQMLDQGGCPVRGYGDLFLELRLGILPIGAAGSPEPAFLSRIWTLAWFHNRDGLPKSMSDDDEFPEELAWPFLPSEAVVSEQFDDEWSVALELPEDILTLEASLGSLVGRGQPLIMKFVDKSEVGGVRIERISPTSCRSLLGLEEDWNGMIDPRMSPAQSLLLDEKSLRDNPDDYVCRTAPRTLGRNLEMSIFLARAECRLDALLDRECGRLADEVKAFVAPYIDTARRMREEFLSGLNQE